MLELLVLAIAPAVFIFLYIYSKDRYEPEPLHLVAWVFILGALSTIPAGVLELPFPEGIISSAVAAPVIEEGLKFLIVFLAVYRRPEFSEPMDGIVYATAASLGFATLENILYVMDGGLAVGIVRAIVSVPGHVIFSCIWGFALGIAKFRPAPERFGIIATGLMGGMLLHGVFNFSIEYFEVWGFLLLLFVVIPLGWWITCRNIRRAQAHPASACSLQGGAGGPVLTGSVPPQAAGRVPENFPGAGMHTTRFCTQCGTQVKEGMRFCGNCGKEVETNS
jgi:RsiW-degrading membrane proteinase PrsW (M82 family)